jgi:hypothetical protein
MYGAFKHRERTHLACSVRHPAAQSSLRLEILLLWHPARCRMSHTQDACAPFTLRAPDYMSYGINQNAVGLNSSVARKYSQYNKPSAQCLILDDKKRQLLFHAKQRKRMGLPS